MTLVLAALATALLIGPVPLHRLLFRQRMRDRMVAIAGRMASGGLFLLMLAMAGGVFMALDAALSRTAAVIIVIAVIVWFVVIWYVLPVVVREGSRSTRVRTSTHDAIAPHRRRRLGRLRCGRRHWGRWLRRASCWSTDADASCFSTVPPGAMREGPGRCGGARSSEETALQTALREAFEEAAVDPDTVTPSHAWFEDHGSWSYTTVVAHATGEVHPTAADRESVEIRWVDLDEVADRPLHPAFAVAWPALRGEAIRRLVLVVDAANVVGSRPDGWWRDRAGAAARLRDGLSAVATQGIPARVLELGRHVVARHPPGGRRAGPRCRASTSRDRAEGTSRRRRGHRRRGVTGGRRAPGRSRRRRHGRPGTPLASGSCRCPGGRPAGGALPTLTSRGARGPPSWITRVGAARS